MKRTRREFLDLSQKCLAGALVGGAVGLGSKRGSLGVEEAAASSQPNILLIMVDQLHTPPEGYGPGEGVVQDLKEILSFGEISPGNAYTKFFPGLMRLRQNAVVMRKHYTAAAACTPSRTCIMTGQYNTGVDQTSGLFRAPDDMTWLDPDGAPTIGDWFRAIGYSTHYFGKWHVSDPEPPDYMEPWGFADWESSYPEAHGGNAYNLGVYRDVSFVDNVVKFLDDKGTGDGKAPWMAVGSLVNPHDCSSWPVNWQMPYDEGVVPWTKYPPPPPNPTTGEKSLPNTEGLEVDLNPDGFPQESSYLPGTYSESLSDKPRCQYDYSLKYGLALKSKAEIMLPLPFPMQGDYATAWSEAYGQFYVYCHYLADLQIRRILQSLDDNDLTGNTIVVFISDHGELAGAHGGMIQKWHNAYEETTRVPMIVSSPLVNPSKTEMREIVQPTSSIDLAPTLLGLAGCHLTKTTASGAVPALEFPYNYFPGADLSTFVKGESAGEIPGRDGRPRPGVLFITNDMITEMGPNPDSDTVKEYDTFLANVKVAIHEGYALEPGPVRQPNNVRALCTGDWKLVRYVDHYGVESDEWELYHLETDPTEEVNLVDYSTGEVRSDVSVPGMTSAELSQINARLKSELAKQEALAFNS